MIRKRVQKPLPRRQRGISFPELLAASVLLGLTLYPALNAVTSGLQASDIERSMELQLNDLTNRFEEVLAMPFATLDALRQGPNTPTNLSDPLGTEGRHLVYVSLYDGDNADADNDPFTGLDQGLLWIRIEIESTHHELQTLKNRP